MAPAVLWKKHSKGLMWEKVVKMTHGGTKKPEEMPPSPLERR